MSNEFTFTDERAAHEHAGRLTKAGFNTSLVGHDGEREIYAFSVARDDEFHWRQFLFDVFTTAMEGGVNYWAGITAYHLWLDKNYNEDLLGFFAVLRDYEDAAEVFDVTPDTIRLGIERFCDQDWISSSYAGRLADAIQRRDFDHMDYDADLADRIVQLGLFGEIVYG